MIKKKFQYSFSRLRNQLYFCIGGVFYRRDRKELWDLEFYIVILIWRFSFTVFTYQIKE